MSIYDLISRIYILHAQKRFDDDTKHELITEVDAIIGKRELHTPEARKSWVGRLAGGCDKRQGR